MIIKNSPNSLHSCAFFLVFKQLLVTKSIGRIHKYGLLSICVDVLGSIHNPAYIDDCISTARHRVQYFRSKKFPSKIWTDRPAWNVWWKIPWRLSSSNILLLIPWRFLHLFSIPPSYGSSLRAKRFASQEKCSAVARLLSKTYISVCVLRLNHPWI